MQQLKAGKTVKVRQFRYGSNIIIEENRSKTKSKNKNERIEMEKNFEIQSQDRNCDRCFPEVKSQKVIQINPFVPSAPFLYPLKTSESFLMFSGGRERVHWEQLG